MTGPGAAVRTVTQIRPHSYPSSQKFFPSLLIQRRQSCRFNEYVTVTPIIPEYRSWCISFTLSWEWDSKDNADGFFFATGRTAIATLQYKKLS